MERKGFIFYKSFYDSIKELGAKDQAQIYNAIFQYQFEGKEIELKGVAKSIFTLIIPQLEANDKKYINGCKGGRPKNNLTETKTKPKNNLNITDQEPKEKDKEKEKDKDKEKDMNIYSLAKQDNIHYKDIIDYLNFKTNSNYKYTTEKTKRFIKARFNEGFTYEDFKLVIDKKCLEWLNDKKMSQYLRPETLFGTKFESYLNQPLKEITTKDLDIDISDFFKEGK